MNDEQIIELYFRRDELAIAESEKSFGAYCRAIVRNVLHSPEDEDECLSDTWEAAWNAIPPARPEVLSAYLGAIARNIALKRLRTLSAAKRGGLASSVVLDELDTLIPDGHSIDERLEARELAEIIDAFLASLPVNERRVFLRRYWYFDSVTDISLRFGYGKSKVKMMLKRTRDKLREHLQKEDISI